MIHIDDWIGSKPLGLQDSSDEFGDNSTEHNESDGCNSCETKSIGCYSSKSNDFVCVYLHLQSNVIISKLIYRYSIII